MFLTCNLADLCKQFHNIQCLLDKLFCQPPILNKKFITEIITKNMRRDKIIEANFYTTKGLC